MLSRGMRILRAALRPRQPLALILALLLCAAPSRSYGTAQGQGEPRIRVDVSLALLEATGKDKAGRVMGNLKHEDFVLDEDRAPPQAPHFSRDQLPLSVTLRVDLR